MNCLNSFRGACLITLILLMINQTGFADQDKSQSLATAEGGTAQLQVYKKWIGASGDEADVDASIAKQRSFDSDLWVIEVEDRDGRHLLDEDGLSG